MVTLLTTRYVFPSEAAFEVDPVLLAVHEWAQMLWQAVEDEVDLEEARAAFKREGR